MRKQQEIWRQEHDEGKLLPSEMKESSVEKPSEHVVRFVDFLKENNIPLIGQAIDIGAGKGRNTFYLARQGFKVIATDYIQSAVDHITASAKKEKLENKIDVYCLPMDEKWPFNDNQFDIAIDCYASIDVETLKGRIAYRNELLRTLKPGGYALVVVVAAEDEFEAELIKNNPGPEPNSSIWPKTGKFQKNYDEKELREFYQDFEIVKLRKISKPAHKMGRDFITTNFWMVLRKN